MINLMAKLLPFIIIPILVLGGLGYWRYSASSQNLTNPQVSSQASESQVPVEVPKVLPGVTLEERVQNLEDTITKLTPQVNNLKSTNSQISPSAPLDSRLANIEAAVVEIKARVSALEKAAPVSYIPVGSAAGPWTNTDWYTLNEYEVSIDPGSYPGYTGMNLEVNFRLVEPTGIGSVRLYNVTDSSVVSAQADTTLSSFSLRTSGTFKLPSGKKTYKLQVKSSVGKDLFIQSARIKVNF